jgi:hypothetical protein
MRAKWGEKRKVGRVQRRRDRGTRARKCDRCWGQAGGGCLREMLEVLHELAEQEGDPASMELEMESLAKAESCQWREEEEETATFKADISLLQQMPKSLSESPMASWLRAQTKRLSAQTVSHYCGALEISGLKVPRSLVASPWMTAKAMTEALADFGSMPKPQKEARARFGTAAKSSERSRAAELFAMVQSLLRGTAGQEVA